MGKITLRNTIRIFTSANIISIFFYDLFIVVISTDIANYADDIGDSSDDVNASMQKSPEKLFQWLIVNQLKDNTGKCNLIVCTNYSAEAQV